MSRVKISKNYENLSEQIKISVNEIENGLCYILDKLNVVDNVISLDRLSFEKVLPILDYFNMIPQGGKIIYETQNVDTYIVEILKSDNIVTMRTVEKVIMNEIALDILFNDRLHISSPRMVTPFKTLQSISEDLNSKVLESIDSNFDSIMNDKTSTVVCKVRESALHDVKCLGITYNKLYDSERLYHFTLIPTLIGIDLFSVTITKKIPYNDLYVPFKK